MKTLFQIACLLSVSILSINVLADTKVKIRQTMSGQTAENTTYIKGKRQRAEQNYGGAQMVMITQCDLKRSLQIMPVSQTYLINSWESAASAPATTTTRTVSSEPITKGGVITTTVTIKDTGERKQMFGYTARHLIITMETASSPEACQKNKSKMEMDGWYIDAEFALDCEMERYAGNSPKYQNGGCQDRYQMKQVGTGKRGFALYEKMTMFDENDKETFSTVSEVVELSKATLDDALFDVPAGYREVKNPAELYGAASGPSTVSTGSTNTGSSKVLTNPKGYNDPVNSGLNKNLENLSQGMAPSPIEIGPKKEGIIRLGLASVKTGAVGEGLSATDLAAAIENTLTEYLNGTKVELVEIEAKLPSAIIDEAQSKECDYIILANVSHKKGGGGFGMFKKMAPVLGSVVPVAGVGSTAGQVAGHVAATAIYTAANFAGNVKAKDEITLDIKLQSAIDNSSPFAKQYKGKAKSDGEDIISPMIEQAAQAIIEAVFK
jgi:hypothetical protein